jgi:hypothetical protein
MKSMRAGLPELRHGRCIAGYRSRMIRAGGLGMLLVLALAGAGTAAAEPKYWLGKGCESDWDGWSRNYSRSCDTGLFGQDASVGEQCDQWGEFDGKYFVRNHEACRREVVVKGVVLYREDCQEYWDDSTGDHEVDRHCESATAHPYGLVSCTASERYTHEPFAPAVGDDTTTCTVHYKETSASVTCRWSPPVETGGPWPADRVKPPQECAPVSR